METLRKSYLEVVRDGEEPLQLAVVLHANLLHWGKELQPLLPVGVVVKTKLCVTSTLNNIFMTKPLTTHVNCHNHHTDYQTKKKLVHEEEKIDSIPSNRQFQEASGTDKWW